MVVVMVVVVGGGGGGGGGGGDVWLGREREGEMVKHT